MTDVFVSHEMQFKGKQVKSGTLFKLRREKEIFAFVSLIHFMKSDSTWILCQGPKGRYRIIEPNDISKVITKRSFRNV